jgi:hypothetical protein
MEATGLIAEADLAKWWGVDQSTFLAVRKAGGIVADQPGAAGVRTFYSPSTIDTFHKGRARHCRVRLPRAAELALGTHQLLSVRQAAQIADRTEFDLYYAVEQGHVGSLRLTDEDGSAIRIPNTELTNYLLRRNNPDAIPLGDAVKALCSSRQDLRPHVGTAIMTVEIAQRGNQIHLGRRSLVAFVDTRLADTVDAEWWLTKQLQHLEDGWLSVEGMRATHHLSKKLLMAALEEGRLYGIRVGNRQWHIPLWAVQLYLHQNRVLRAAEVAAMFGVDETLAQWWIDTRALCKIKHTRAHCPKLSCVESYIATHRLSDTVDAHAWVEVSESPDDRVFTSASLASNRITEEDIVGAARVGWFLGVLLPPDQSGHVGAALLDASMRLLNRYLEFTARQLGSGDYKPNYLY